MHALGLAQLEGRLVVDRSIDVTISSTQNRSWTRSWPARASMSASGWSVSSRMIAAASGVGVAGRHEQAGDAVLDHLRDAAHVRRDHRPAQRHRLEDREALGLAVGGQDRHVERGRHRRHVVAAAGEDDPVRRSEQLRACASSASRSALADDEQPGARDRPRGPAARPRAGWGGPSRARAGPRRPRSASLRARCRTPRGACSRAAGGCSGRGRRRCRSG